MSTSAQISHILIFVIPQRYWYWLSTWWPWWR